MNSQAKKETPVVKSTRSKWVLATIVAVMAVAVVFFSERTNQETKDLDQTLITLDRAGQLLASAPMPAPTLQASLDSVSFELSLARDQLQRNRAGSTQELRGLDSLLAHSVQSIGRIRAAVLVAQYEQAWSVPRIQSQLTTAQQTIESVSSRIKGTHPSPDSEISSVARSARDVVRSVAYWLASIAWPLVVVGVLLFLLGSSKGPNRLARLLDSFDSFSLGFLSGTTRKVQRADDVVSNYRLDIGNRLDKIVAARELDTKLANVCQELATTWTKPFRSTIYIEDPVLSEHLYQLVEYWKKVPERKRGRSFSIYFGIIGRAWRLNESQVEGQVPTDVTMLIKQWSMTREHAQSAAAGHQSFAAILFKDASGRAESMLYFDAKEVDVFGADSASQQQFQEAVTELATKHGLKLGLQGIGTELGHVIKLSFIG